MTSLKRITVLVILIATLICGIVIYINALNSPSAANRWNAYEKKIANHDKDNLAKKLAKYFQQK